jgi:hypothetical protein
MPLALTIDFWLLVSGYWLLASKICVIRVHPQPFTLIIDYCLSDLCALCGKTHRSFDRLRTKSVALYIDYFLLIIDYYLSALCVLCGKTKTV